MNVSGVTLEGRDRSRSVELRPEHALTRAYDGLDRPKAVQRRVVYLCLAGSTVAANEMAASEESWHAAPRPSRLRLADVYRRLAIACSTHSRGARERPGLSSSEPFEG